MRLSYTRIRSPELQPQIHNPMRAANQPIQPADLHVPLVLVPAALLRQLLRTSSVDLTHVATSATPLRQPSLEHAQLLSDAERDDERGAQAHASLHLRELAATRQARLTRGQATEAQVHRRVSQVRRGIHPPHDRHAYI